MKNLMIIFLIAAALLLSGFILLERKAAVQTEEYVLVRFQEMGKRSVVALYYADTVVDRTDDFKMNKTMQGPNLDKIVPVLEGLNREGFTLVTASTSNGIYQGTGGFNGIYFVMKRTVTR